MWSQMFQDAMKNTGAAMMKTTTEVKQYKPRLTTEQLEERIKDMRFSTDSMEEKQLCEDLLRCESDYAILQRRCGDLEECVRELCEAIVRIVVDAQDRRYKALALLGGEKGVGT